MTSLKRLSDLYHSQATDLTTRNNELEALLTDLQRGAAARDAEALEAKEAAQRAREALHEVEGVRDAANEKVIELEARLKEVTTGQGGLDAGIEAVSNEKKKKRRIVYKSSLL